MSADVTVAADENTINRVVELFYGNSRFNRVSFTTIMKALSPSSRRIIVDKIGHHINGSWFTSSLIRTNKTLEEFINSDFNITKHHAMIVNTILTGNTKRRSHNTTRVRSKKPRISIISSESCTTSGLTKFTIRDDICKNLVEIADAIGTDPQSLVNEAVAVYLTIIRK
jgi:hypothetical protein